MVLQSSSNSVLRSSAAGVLSLTHCTRPSQGQLSSVHLRTLSALSAPARLCVRLCGDRRRGWFRVKYAANGCVLPFGPAAVRYRNPPGSGARNIQMLLSRQRSAGRAEEVGDASLSSSLARTGEQTNVHNPELIGMKRMCWIGGGWGAA